MLDLSDEFSQALKTAQRLFKHSPLALQESFHDFTKDQASLLKEITKGLKKLSLKVSRLEERLIECQHWACVYHEGILLQAHLYLWRPGNKFLEVCDWEEGQQTKLIPLSPPLSAKEEVAKRFRLAKKLKLGVAPTERILAEAKKELEALQSIYLKVEALAEYAPLLEIRHFLFPPRRKPIRQIEKKEKSQPYRQFWSASGKSILVGKKAKDNERLTFTIAHGSDWWLHVRDFPGSHVIIQGCKQHDPDPETLQDAMQLALFYSQAPKQGKVEVMATQQKYVSRFGKSSHSIGKVQVAKFKTHLVELDDVHLEQVSKRRLVKKDNEICI